MKKNNNDPNSLTAIGHLEEMRKRIFYVLGFLAAGTLVSFFIAGRIITLLRLPSVSILENLVFVKPTEVIVSYFKVALYSGFIFTSPAILYQVWKFIQPALRRETSVSFMLWSVSFILLFLLGSLFAYKVIIPLGLGFLIRLSAGIAEPMITLQYYISFVLALMILAGGMFEMPVIAAFLTRLRIITPVLMRRRRKEAIFALFVIAAVLTPTTDVFNMAIFVIPMLILYEVSILVSGIIYKSQKRTIMEVYNEF